MKKYFATFFLSLCCLWTLSAQDTVKNYWSNKKLMSIGLQKNGKEDGLWVYYHKNGVKWTWTPYSVLPGCDGAPSIFIKWQELKEFRNDRFEFHKRYYSISNFRCETKTKSLIIKNAIG